MWPASSQKASRSPSPSPRVLKNLQGDVWSALVKGRLIPLLDHEALRRAAEIAVCVCKPRHGEPRAIRADPAVRIEQDPFADGLTRHAHCEVGIDENPLTEIKRRRGAVAEVGGDHRAHRLRD